MKIEAFGYVFWFFKKNKTHNEKMRNWIKRQKRLGRCIKCNNPVTKNKKGRKLITCFKHRKTLNHYSKLRRRKKTKS